MLKKILGAICLFYVFALLQNSFLNHFAFFGATPNLVFILFFLLIFFVPRGRNFLDDYQLVLWAVIAGFFLDVFFYSYMGLSIVLLLVIGISVKKTQSLLKNRENKFPFVYFLPLFVVFFLIYKILFTMSFDLRIIAEVIYNMIFATIGFFIFRKYVQEI